MSFTPKSEKEINEAQLWPKGEVDFECIKAEPAKSGPDSKVPGTEFIKLVLQCWNADGATRFVNGILHPAMDAQLRHFCEVGEMLDKYETGTLSATDCVGVTGRLKLKVKEAQGNYPAKNEVQDYVVKREEKEPAETVSTVLPTTEPASAPNPPEDDVPF